MDKVIGYPLGSVPWAYGSQRLVLGSQTMEVTDFPQPYIWVLLGADLTCTDATSPVTASVQWQQAGISELNGLLQLYESSSGAGGWYTFAWRGAVPLGGNDVLLGQIGDGESSQGSITFWGYAIPRIVIPLPSIS